MHKKSMSYQDLELPSDTQVALTNRSESIKRKKHKENCSESMRMHNFTECCRMWMCPHCSKSFASSRALKIHEVKQHENATRHVLKCGTCHEEFEHANLLHIHMRVHHNVKVRCPRCKDIFEHPNGLKVHIKAHHSEPVCVTCGLKFDHDKLLRLHMEHYHNVKGKGLKQNAKGATSEGSKRTKVELEREASKDEETEEACTENEQEDADSEPSQSPGLGNEAAPNEWDLGDHRTTDFDEETMSHESSDSREKGSTDGEEGDGEVSQESDYEALETENNKEQQGQGRTDFNSGGTEESAISEETKPCEKVVRGVEPQTDSLAFSVESGNFKDVVRVTDDRSTKLGVIAESVCHEGVLRAINEKPENSGLRVQSDCYEKNIRGLERFSGHPGFGAEREYREGNAYGEMDRKTESPGLNGESGHNKRVFRSSLLRTENDYSKESFRENECKLSPSSFERNAGPNQLQRSSVIVTTGCVSPPREYLRPIEEEPDQDSTESATISVATHDWDCISPKRSPRSLAGSYTGSLPGSPASAASEDESGDSGSASHKARAIKRVTLRCNRCQEEFISKMEYLHHLISHQKGDITTARQNELIPENDTIQKLKSSLRIKMEAKQRDILVDDSRQGTNTEKTCLDETNGSRSSDQTVCRTGLQVDKEDPSRGLTIPCTLCSKEFLDMEDLKAHMDSRHKKPQCIECGLQFDHKNLLKIHMNSYHSSFEMLQCYHCSKSFTNRSEFVSHVTSHETTVEKTKEIRRGHKPLRRISSAPVTGQSQNRISSERKLFLRDDQSPALSDTCVSKNRVNEEPSLLRADNFKSPFDDIRASVDQGFSPFSIFRHRKQESGEWFCKENSNILVGPEARTRIFLPKRHEVADPTSSDRPRIPEEIRTALSSQGSEKSRESVRERPMTSSEGVGRASSVFTAYERADRSNELSKHLFPGRANRERESAPPLRGPPPLIPVVHPRLSTGSARNSGASSLRAHQPVTRTVSANSALRNHRVLPYPTPSSKWTLDLHRTVPSSPVTDFPREIPREPQEHRSQEQASRESINNLTKEALLNSLSLKRRASAPELGALARPVSEPQRSAQPETSTIKNLLGESVHRTESSKSPLASQPRQANEGYQPRRKNQRDFTCHHCGIYFGHKKLLKIHLDCYHGSAQDLQCLRCEKNFSNRTDFLEHLMSHEGGDELLAFQRKRLRLDRRPSLPHEGETIIRRELNVNVLRETAARDEKPVHRETEPTDLRRKFQHPLSEELRQGENQGTREFADPKKANVNHEARLPSVKSSFEKNNEEDGANFCFVCGQAFSNGKKLEQHISSHAVVDNNGRYCCSLCHKTFDHHRKLEIHTRSHTGFKPHKCEFCGRCFPYYSSYYYHKMTHTEDRPHKCEICGKGFIQTRYLRSHMKTHKEQNGWASDEEVNTENSSEPINNKGKHAETTRSAGSETVTKVKVEPLEHADGFVSSRPFEEHDTARILCSFKQSSSVAVHDQISQRDDRSVHVTPEGPQCAEESPNLNRSEESDGAGVAVVTSSADCPVNFQVEESAATNLISTTTKKKKYKCKHCEKNFSSYSSLHVHVRIHTGQRPYSCTHCFKSFTHSSGLKRHVRCHTGEKPYSCPACPSAFADRGALKSHIRTHTGERPFVCDMCRKTFTQPSSLRVHKKTVHAHEFIDEK